MKNEKQQTILKLYLKPPLPSRRSINNEEMLLMITIQLWVDEKCLYEHFSPFLFFSLYHHNQSAFWCTVHTTFRVTFFFAGKTNNNNNHQHLHHPHNPHQHQDIREHFQSISLLSFTVYVSITSTKLWFGSQDFFFRSFIWANAIAHTHIHSDNFHNFDLISNR